MDIKIDSQGIPYLDQFNEEGFIDCVFRIIDLRESENSYKFHIRSIYNDVILGVNVEVIKGIKAGFDSEMSLIQEHVYKNAIQFINSGSESDRLMTTLAYLYGIEDKPRRMVEAETFTGIALHQGEIDMKTETIKIKIFGNDEGDDDYLEKNYYESFFNLDLVNGIVTWNEKDQDYREPLIQGLSL